MRTASVGGPPDRRRIDKRVRPRRGPDSTVEFCLIILSRIKISYGESTRKRVFLDGMAPTGEGSWLDQGRSGIP
jgi:hypothetical protein